jgi:hypothetical protein
MSSIKESFIQFFQDENTKSSIKAICRPIGHTIYEEMFIYIVIFSIYNMLLFILIMVILILLLNLTRNLKISKDAINIVV